MINRRLTLRLGLLVVLQVGVLSFFPTQSILAQADLSGTYDVATLTPLQRPAHFGNNLHLTVEQAEQMAAAQQKLLAEGDVRSDGNRQAPPSGGDGSDGAAGNVGGYNRFWIDNGDQAFHSQDR